MIVSVGIFIIICIIAVIIVFLSKQSTKNGSIKKKIDTLKDLAEFIEDKYNIDVNSDYKIEDDLDSEIRMKYVLEETVKLLDKISLKLPKQNFSNTVEIINVATGTVEKNIKSHEIYMCDFKNK